MADVHAASDEIKSLVNEWTDANDLDQTLEDLHYIPRAVQEALAHYAEQLRESTQLAPHIADAVEEAASGMAGIADSLQEQIRYGVQQN
jgi:methyl-accepting chemotaxis protein